MSAIRPALSCALVGVALLVAENAHAEAADSPEAAFERAVASLDEGAPSEAIAELELLADQGFSHPDASVNRAIAYIERARSTGARPGDLGRAAAALGEALLLRPDDEDAAFALDRVRSEIARKRSQQGGGPIDARPSLPRALAGLFGENIWALLAALGSAVLTVGLAIRAWARVHAARLGGVITAWVGLLALTAGGTAAFAAHRFRTTSEPAVVVAPETRLLDEHGTVIVSGATPAVIPEGARVDVLARRGDLARVEWGDQLGWVAASDVRALARR